MKYTIDQIKEIIKDASSQGELHDLTEELDRLDYSDDKIRELSKLITERLIEISCG